MHLQTKLQVVTAGRLLIFRLHVWGEGHWRYCI